MAFALQPDVGSHDIRYQSAKRSTVSADMPFKRGRISPDMPIKRGTSLDLPAHRKHCPPPPTWGRARVDLAGDGAIAQLGERLVRNEEVSGSIPLGSTTPDPFLISSAAAGD